MRARTYGPRIAAHEALADAVWHNSGLRAGVTMRHADTGEERPWSVYTSGRLVDGGIDLIAELDETHGSLDLARSICAAAIVEARVAGWRVETVHCDTPSGGSQWRRSTGQIDYAGTRGAFRDCHQWSIVTRGSAWRVTESDVPWLAPRYTAHDLAARPARCVLDEHVVGWISGDRSVTVSNQWIADGLRAARRLATDRPDDAARVLEILAQITTGRTRSILLDRIDRIEALRFEDAATQELPAAEVQS